MASNRKKIIMEIHKVWQSNKGVVIPDIEIDEKTQCGECKGSTIRNYGGDIEDCHSCKGSGIDSSFFLDDVEQAFEDLEKLIIKENGVIDIIFPEPHPLLPVIVDNDLFPDGLPF